MAEATQAWQVAKEMREFGIEVPGIRLSEIRWKDAEWREGGVRRIRWNWLGHILRRERV